MKYKFLYTVTLFLLVLSGCEKKKEQETILKVLYTSVDFTEKGGTGVIVVETNAPLTAQSNADWCTVSVSDAQVNVLVAANNELTNRTATVTLTAGNKTEKVPITQEGFKQTSRILTYEELLGEYTLTAKIGNDSYYGKTTFSFKFLLEPSEDGQTYLATIENYLPDEAFEGFWENGEYEQIPFEIIYSNGSLEIPNVQLFAFDSVEDEVLVWAVLYIVWYLDGEMFNSDENLTYIGRWDGSLEHPVFMFSGSNASYSMVGCMPLWLNTEPDDEEEDFIDAGLFLYDWILTKINPIP